MKTNLLVILMVICSNNLTAQEMSRSRWHVGAIFSLDQNITHYTLSDWVFQGFEDIKDLDAKAGIGFSAGMTFEYRLSRTAALRLSPLVAFQDNELRFIHENDKMLAIAIHPKTLGLPLHFMYAPRGRAKIPYFFLGPRIHTQLGERFDPSLFSIARTNLSAEFGLGFTIKTKSFSFSPQLSYSQVIANLKAVGESGLYNNAVRSIKSDRLSLAIILGLVER